MYRFDIYGLSPDANEDEAGIKRASENSTFYKFHCNFVLMLGELVYVRFDCRYCLLISPQLKP